MLLHSLTKLINIRGGGACCTRTDVCLCETGREGLCSVKWKTWELKIKPGTIIGRPSNCGLYLPLLSPALLSSVVYLPNQVVSYSNTYVYDELEEITCVK